MRLNYSLTEFCVNVRIVDTKVEIEKLYESSLVVVVVCRFEAKVGMINFYTLYISFQPFNFTLYSTA